jgi:hypothetical protein
MEEWVMARLSGMKITDAHFRELEGLIRTLDAEEVRQSYREGNFPRSEMVKDLDKRYRWDLFWAATRSEFKLRDALNAYLNDSHIDTALRAMVKPLKP